MKILSRLSRWLIVRLYKTMSSLLISTCRCKIYGLNEFIETAQKEKCILALWHDRIAIVPTLLHKYTPEVSYLAVISNSRDGQLLGQLAASYEKGRALFVSHDKRGIALKSMVSELRQGQEVLVITPDGPRGPKHCLKPGVAMTALHNEAVVVPFQWQASRSWLLNTWDQMAIPKPFSTLHVYFGQPVQVSPSHSLQEVVTQLEDALFNAKNSSL